MSEFKGTPGPWKLTYHLYDNGIGGCTETIGTDSNSWIAEAKGTHVFNGTADEVLANAQLIAAAPELLEALMFCQSVIAKQGMFDLSERMAYDKATEAINKALGKEIESHV